MVDLVSLKYPCKQTTKRRQYKIEGVFTPVIRLSQNLATDFCLVAREFSELRCLMNTLDCCRYKLNFDKHLHCKSIPLNLSVNHSFNSTVGLSLIFVFATFSRLGLGLQCFASLRGVTVGGHLFLNYCLNFFPRRDGEVH